MGLDESAGSAEHHETGQHTHFAARASVSPAAGGGGAAWQQPLLQRLQHQDLSPLLRLPHFCSPRNVPRWH